MIWWLIGGGIIGWVGTASIAVWSLSHGLAPEGSRRARIAKPLAGSLGLAKLAAVAAAGIFAGSKLSKPLGADGAERREAIDRLDDEADGLRSDVSDLLDEQAERESSLLRDMTADVDADMADADAEARELRNPDSMTPAEAAADAEAWVSEVRKR